MRIKRNRRKNRKCRKYSKKVYIDSTIRIQRCFRRFIDIRYADVCSNYKDDDCIMLDPIKMIPRDVLIVMNDIGFDCRHLLSWIKKSNSHPLTRGPILDSDKKSCFDRVINFLENEIKRNSNRKGFFSRKKILKRTLEQQN